MFCDLVGSTNLSLSLDPEDYTNIVRVYRDTTVSVIRNWKGYVARYVGDGVLAYFGYPKASEDDALRAVAAGWELARAVAALPLSNLGLAADISPELSLQVRVGIHTGLALVGDMVSLESSEIDAVSGAAPNIAAKLQSLARPNDVVISEATARLLPPAVQTRPVDAVRAQANMTGISAFTVASFPDQLVARRSITADCFVGRGGLMSRVVSSIANARVGVNYLFVGEPGIGKSRFIREVIKHPAASTYAWIELSCRPHGQSSTLHPFRSLLAGVRSDPDGAHGEAVATGEAGPTTLSPFQRRRRTFEVLKTAILARAPDVGLVLEDIHWADPTTLEFVAEPCRLPTLPASIG